MITDYETFLELFLFISCVLNWKEDPYNKVFIIVRNVFL